MYDHTEDPYDIIRVHRQAFRGQYESHCFIRHEQQQALKRCWNVKNS